MVVGRHELGKHKENGSDWEACRVGRGLELGEHSAPMTVMNVSLFAKFKTPRSERVRAEVNNVPPKRLNVIAA